MRGGDLGTEDGRKAVVKITGRTDEPVPGLWIVHLQYAAFEDPAEVARATEELQRAGALGFPMGEVEERVGLQPMTGSFDLTDPMGFAESVDCMRSFTWKGLYRLFEYHLLGGEYDHTGTHHYLPFYRFTLVPWGDPPHYPVCWCEPKVALVPGSHVMYRQFDGPVFDATEAFDMKMVVRYEGVPKEGDSPVVMGNPEEMTAAFAFPGSDRCRGE